MTTIIPDQPLPRRTESGMHTRAVNAAAGVLLAAMQQGWQTSTGLAIALDSARLLNSPETAARVVEMEIERHTTNEALSDAAEALREMRDRIAELEARLYTEQAHGRTFLEQRNAHAQELLKLRPALREAQAQIAELEARLAEYERPADEDPIAYTITDKATDTYPPALPWAKTLDADDLEEFLADLADAASGDDDLSTLAEVEDAIARWRLIGEAQHAHNTAPGPNAEAGDAR